MILPHSKRLLILISFVGTFCQAPSSAEVKVKARNPLDIANAAYESGDCELAVRKYESLLKDSSLDAETDLKSTYRKAYCDYNLGNLEAAETGFESVLKRAPGEQEARLHYAEVLFDLGKYEESVANAFKVSDLSLTPPARVLAAKGFIAMKESDKALQTLEHVSPKGDQSWQPLVEYWRGIAYYDLFDESAAERSFSRSFRSSADELWTKSASENWLRNIKESSRWFHARAGITAGYDTNVAQYTTRSSRNAEPDSTSYVRDLFESIDIAVSTKPLPTGKITWVPSLSSYMQFHHKQVSYDVQSIVAQLAASYQASPRWTLRSSLAYTDYRYHWRYYQDYLSLNFSALYGISKTSSAHFGFGLTRQIITRPGWSYGPSIGIESELPSFYWLANASLTVTTGQKAGYTSSGSLASGIMFSNYTSTNLRLGLGHAFKNGWDILGQISMTNSFYQKEDVTTSVAFSTDERQDLGLTFSATLSKSIIERRLTSNFGYSYTINQSDGFQGLIGSTGSSADYNYTRHQLTASLSYGF